SLANLPRKFKTSIGWLADIPYEANDVAFIGVVHAEHGPGFDLWVGGGLSTNPMLAKRLGVWIPLDEVADAWLGVISIFRDYGYRRLRARARLKFLLADWGVERFREVLETEYLHRKLVDGPPPALPGRPYDHIGVHAQRDGNRYVGGAPIAGRVNGCPNACARTQVADIGLKGQLVPGPDGELVEGFQVHLGGGLTMAAGQSASLGRKLRGLKTTSADLVEYVERLARRYAAGRTEG